MADNDDVSQFELVGRRKSPRLHNIEEEEEEEDLNAGPSLAHKAIMKKIIARGSSNSLRPLPLKHLPKTSQPNNTVSEITETPPLDKIEEPVAQTLPCKPSETSQALKSPPPKTPASPGDVTSPIPEPAQTVHKPVKRRCRGNKSSPLLPTRRSSKLKNSSTELEGTGTAGPANPTPDNQAGPAQTPKPPPKVPTGTAGPANPTPDNQAGPAQTPKPPPKVPTGIAGPANPTPDNQAGPAQTPKPPPKVPTGTAKTANPTPDNQAGPAQTPKPPPKVPTGTAKTANPTPDNQAVPTETPKAPPKVQTGPAETINQTPDNSSPPMSPSSPPTAETTASESPTHQSDSDWSDGVRRQAANQQGSTGDSESLVDSEGEEMHPAVKDDDGGKRGIIRRKLRDCEEALALNLRELDEENAEGGEGKRKRKRGQKSDVRRGRGMAKYRKPAAPECRPELRVVGDVEFTSYPPCTKVVTTIRILTLENLPGPYRTYNMFPTKARLEIVEKFLQRYSWAEGEDVKRCLEVYEKIASEAYGREFTVLRKKYDKKYGKDKEVWKDFPPQWCKNPLYWKGLCLIWSKEKWSKVSSTNRDNKIGEDGEEKVIHHVAGSRSTFRHKQALVSEKGSAVSLKEVFDRTHMKVSGESKVYVNQKAERVATAFEDLKEIHGEVMSDEDLWELAADGEDTRGRLYGFGNKSRTCKVNQALAAEDASMSDPTKSTATSAEDERGAFTKSQVAMLVASKVAVERKAFAKDIAEQEERHNKAFEEYKKKTEHNRACIEALYRQMGVTIPTSNEAGSSKSNDGGGADGVVEKTQQAQNKD